jgi:hypothetical protein
LKQVRSGNRMVIHGADKVCRNRKSARGRVQEERGVHAASPSARTGRSKFSGVSIQSGIEAA